jgi:hypothetical protein
VTRTRNHRDDIHPSLHRASGVQSVQKIRVRVVAVSPIEPASRVTSNRRPRRRHRASRMSGSWEHIAMTDADDDDARDVLIGVLAIQGSFREHAALVRKAHPRARAVEVRKGCHLRDVRGLIIPGGSRRRWRTSREGSGCSNRCERSRRAGGACGGRARG